MIELNMKIFNGQKYFLSCAALMLTVSCLTAQPLNVTIVSFTNASCNGVCNGTVTASASGGVAPYTYQWIDLSIPDTIGGATDSSITGLCDGNYAIEVTDNSGSVDSATVTITEPAIFTSLITGQTDILCAGNCDGTATVTPSGGTPPYTYLWLDAALIPLSPLQTDSVATNLCALVYAVQIEDANGCISVSSVTIVQPTPLNVSLNSMAPAQCIVCDGSALVSASGGIPPYTYLWNDPYAQTTSFADSLCTSTYEVVVTDSNGCTTTLDVVVMGPSGFFSSIDTTSNSTCAGFCDGQAIVMGSGGSAPYTYDWINPGIPDTVFAGTNSSITSLCADSYFTMVTDNNGCVSTTAIFNITEPLLLSANIIDSSGVTCFGDSNGTATVSIINGIAPYNYTWSSGGSTIGSTDSTNTETGLLPGTYSVAVTDSNNCSAIDSVVIVTPFPLTAAITDSIIASCSGVCDGGATVTAGGGTQPYTYLWSNGNTDSIADSLCAGAHTVNVTDTNGCSTVTGVTIAEPPVLLSNTTDSTLISCNGECDGDVTLMITGGVPPYTYLWSNGDTNAMADSLCAGSFTVTVTDSNNCLIQDSILITEPLLLVANIDDSSAVCKPLCNGNTLANPSGGIIPYSYLWSNGDTTPTADSLCSGMHQLTVTDANGCTVIDSVIVLADSLPPVADAGPNTEGCEGENVTLGASIGLSYSWSPSTGLNCTGCPNPEATLDTTITYTIIVTNIACTDSDEVTITVNLCLLGPVPEIITPNEDGTNDIFEIPNIEQYPDNKVMIFNQWGDVVFSTARYHNVNNYWDGKTNNGKRLPDGTYFYVLQLGDGTEAISGHVMIYR